MFYSLVKAYARFALKIFCKKIVINFPGNLHQRGPVLLACNHPNSFLDGIILTTLFDHRVHSLARGDAFKNKWISKILYNIQLLPVYRTSEGVENLEHNYTTFAACIDTFKKNEIVLIFSEGRCDNEWHLRPLKKGTARLAISAWKNDIELQVIPTALNYSSFKKFGKEVHLFFGTPIEKKKVFSEPTEGRQLLLFNEELNAQLSKLVYEITPSDRLKRRKIFNIKKNVSIYFLLLPALIGIIIHSPLFIPVTAFTTLRYGKSGHFDSVQTALLLLMYPFYWLAMSLVSFMIEPWIACIVFPLFPLTAWAAVQIKYQADI